MAQNYRYQPNRPERFRGERYQTGGERDRYHTGGEQRFRPERSDYGRQTRGFEGDRSYSQGGYAEEFGYQRRGRNRDGYGDRDHGNRDYDTEFSLARDNDTSTSRWHEDRGDGGGYFDTGNYIDDGDAWRGFGRDFERARARAQQEDAAGYRGEGRSYEDRSGWDYGPSRERQSFRGRGPQGYRRSDERLKEIICERLTEDTMIDASDITVEVTDQTVKLTGTVGDRSTKYEIEELIERCGGVKDIDNQVRVQSSRWDFTPGNTGKRT